MIDLHTHTFFSDGVLCPAELIGRAIHAGYVGIALTDHCDYSNYKHNISAVVSACEKINRLKKDIIKCIPGIELTYVLPEDIPDMIKASRAAGAKIVVVHGETPVEPVPAGTNHYAILGKADILAHPGLITSEDFELALENNVYIEITARYGHSLGNGHIANLAKKYACKNIVLNTDTHTPDNLISDAYAEKVLKCAGFNSDEIKIIFNNSEKIINSLIF
jgi:putative hydrolase